MAAPLGTGFIQWWEYGSPHLPHLLQLNYLKKGTFPNFSRGVGTLGNSDWFPAWLWIGAAESHSADTGTSVLYTTGMLGQNQSWKLGWKRMSYCMAVIILALLFCWLFWKYPRHLLSQTYRVMNSHGTSLRAANSPGMPLSESDTIHPFPTREGWIRSHLIQNPSISQTTDTEACPFCNVHNLRFCNNSNGDEIHHCWQVFPVLKRTPEFKSQLSHLLAERSWVSFFCHFIYIHFICKMRGIMLYCFGQC